MLRAFSSMKFCAVGNLSVWHVMTKDKDAPPLRAQIDENLKRVYDEALVAEVPDRFKELLAKLRQKEDQK